MKTIEISRKDLVKLLKSFVKTTVGISYCPSHLGTIKYWLFLYGYDLVSVEKLGSYKGYIVHYKSRDVEEKPLEFTFDFS